MENTTENSGSTPSQAGQVSSAGSSSTLENCLREGGKVLREVGRCLGRTAEDLTGLMVLRVEKERREQLDLLVSSGAVETRAQGLKLLADAGARTRERVFERIASTRAQIEALKKGLKDMAGSSG